MLKKILITLAALVVIVGPLVGIKMSQIKRLMASGGQFQMPPETVSTATVTEESWKQTLTAVGSLSAVQGVMVSSESAGKVIRIHFDSGQAVKEGQLLLELDVSTEVAQLAAAKADEELAKINLDRTNKLLQSDTVAEADLDSARATFLGFKSPVKSK